MVRTNHDVVVETDRPHTYVTERQLHELLRRLLDALLPNPLDRLSVNLTLRAATVRVKSEVRLPPIDFNDPLRKRMIDRGRLKEIIYNDFVHVAPRKTPISTVGIEKLFSLNYERQLFGSHFIIAALKRTPDDVFFTRGARAHTASSGAPLRNLPPSAASLATNLLQHLPSVVGYDNFVHVTDFSNKVVSKSGHQGLPFHKTPTKSDESWIPTAPAEKQPPALGPPTAPTTPPSVKALRTDITA